MPPADGLNTIAGYDFGLATAAGRVGVSFIRPGSRRSRRARAAVQLRPQAARSRRRPSSPARPDTKPGRRSLSAFRAHRTLRRSSIVDECCRRDADHVRSVGRRQGHDRQREREQHAHRDEDRPDQDPHRSNGDVRVAAPKQEKSENDEHQGRRRHVNARLTEREHRAGPPRPAKTA